MDVYNVQLLVAAAGVLLCVLFVALLSLRNPKLAQNSSIAAYLRFIYANFFKPLRPASNEPGQQQALEGFYSNQASIYDATRKRLLRGREDMLSLLAAQLKHKHGKSNPGTKTKPIWVDIGGGTGYNIEAMAAYLPVEKYFSHVYLVDLSPSLCEVARQRFARLGWKNVSVCCQDARSFQSPTPVNEEVPKADLVTMSYSLSMIPVQNIVDLTARNYTGGGFNRHVNWLGRVFWRAWFDVDRVNLEAARRDYLEYRFGTVLSASDRNYLLGGIPYYIFVGCQKDTPASTSQDGNEAIEKLDASLTESPYLSPTKHRDEMTKEAQKNIPEIRSKAYESAIINLSSNLPLPSFFYQNHHWRICYNEFLPKHTQFNNEYIYAFTWEDPQVDHRLLKIGRDDVILAITSAGDNILDYLQARPRRIHAVDLNPNQNHLLELKTACFSTLGYQDVWKVFGEGKHPQFRELLISQLSTHMSSQAFQFWLDNSSVFTSRSGRGLYETGGSRHALKLVRHLFRIFGLTEEVKKLCAAQSINEQRQIWPHIRRILLSKPLNWAVVGTEWFAWKAAGVPAAQRNMILKDYFERNTSSEGTDSASTSDTSGRAIWEYVVDTLDPVVEHTLIGRENYFYLLCLTGQYSKKCCPTYLTPTAHTKLSTPGAFDGLRIHTDEIQEVISRMAPETLSIAVVMDSMDWFDPPKASPKPDVDLTQAPECTAREQVRLLNRALQKGGRVLLRSASIQPWYISVFEANGFSARRVGARFRGSCIDRVNMYASTWICTKVTLSQSATESPVTERRGSGSINDDFKL
ncbi:hypothetical protein FQN57_005484 [Myotisia sp. PD_48]|nr:hypothetical protein FQN57_005484 [Myotisia sp. PD_48]